MIFKSINMVIYLRLFQRDARGSITFKIVPSYRSAPPPCEVSVATDAMRVRIFFIYFYVEFYGLNENTVLPIFEEYLH